MDTVNCAIQNSPNVYFFWVMVGVIIILIVRTFAYKNYLKGQLERQKQYHELMIENRDTLKSILEAIKSK